MKAHMMRTKSGRWGIFFGHEIAGVRAFDWQLDYRWTRWLPLGAREGWGGWHILPLGPLGNITLGRMCPR